MPHHDLVIIGSGSGNSILGPDLEGLDAAIVEEGTFGGTCLNVGCIPTKMFVVPADRVLDGADAARLGVTFPEPEVDWPAMRDRVFGRIDPISEAGVQYRRGQSGVTLYPARARFVGERRLTLSSGEELTADRIVIASGSRPAGLDLDGLREPDPEAGVHTSDTVMRLEGLPPRMAIIGGGFVACEFAHVFSALGVHVTQVQRSAHLLRTEEVEVSERYTEIARRRYDLRLSTHAVAAARLDGMWRLELQGADGASHVEAEVVLLGVGRHPNSDLLDPSAGGIDTHPDGRIVVDGEQRTTAPGVWALGDVSSPHQLKHVANREARIVSHNLAVDLGRVPGPPERDDGRPVPHAVFGHPQIASFGPTAAELEESGTTFVTKTQAVGDVAYGWALEDTSGFLTVHATPEGRILAAHALGPHSSSIIQTLIHASSFGQHAHEVARGQYWIHPALAEVVENALLGLPLPPAG
ncbi:MAG: mycothione reductase [Ornithinibacter sp.]